MPRLHLLSSLRERAAETFKDITMGLKIAGIGLGIALFCIGFESIAWWWPDLTGNYGWLMWVMLPFIMIGSFVGLCQLVRIWRRIRGSVEGDDLDYTQRTESALDKTMSG